MRWVRRITGVLFCVGAGLLVLHLVGRLVPLRHPALYAEATHFKDDITLTYAEARARLVPRPGESPRDFAVRANDVVSHGMAHYWDDEGAARFRIHVPVWENYLLWAAGIASPKWYGKWEFMDPDRALERGVGLCSQQSIVLVHALRRSGLPAVIVGLDGHVVVMAAVGPDTDILLDPDYGVVVPHGIGEVQDNPELVRPYYAAKYVERQVDTLVRIYGPEGNFVDPSGAENYTATRRRREDQLYAAAWALPVLLMAPHGLVLAGTAVRRRGGR